MADLIYRQAAIEAFYCADELIVVGEANARNVVNYINKVVGKIENLPSAQPEPHWIPCSERLPRDEDYDETFTVTIQCEHVDGWDDYVTGYADWTPHGWDIQSNYLGQIKVTAWMPLPEPARLEETDG